MDLPSSAAMPSWSYRTILPSFANGSKSRVSQRLQCMFGLGTVILGDLVACRLIRIEVMFSVEPAPPLYLAIEGYCGAKSWYKGCLLEILYCCQICGSKSSHEQPVSYRLSARIRQVEDGDASIGLGIN